MKNRLLYLLLACCAEGYAQQNTQEEDSVLNLLPQASAPYSDVEIPRIIPPSPETFSIFRFVDYPVNHSTGVPEISIPLYNITCGSLNVPIAIDYHAGGRQISDLSGPIGLGWILNAGGIISRTIYGFPDEEQPVPSNLKKSTEISIKNDYRYLAGLYYKPGSDEFGEFKDSEYDIFSYSLPGMSGHFVLDNNMPRSLTLNQVKITGGTNGFTITGEDGTKYIFRDYGNSMISASYVNYSSTARTTWFLNEIQSADGKHTIRLTYEGVKLTANSSTVSYSLVGEKMIVNDMLSGSYQGGGIIPTSYQTSALEMSFSSMRLKEIDFETGKISFEVEATGGKVKKIFIKDASGTVVKTYELTHSLLDKVSLDNYKLDEITSKSGNNKTDTYRFEYYPSSDRIMANQYDYWGYVNDNLAPVSSFIPEFQIYYDQKLRTVGHSGTLRETNENKKKSGVLKKITYPTGNSTEFIYETNKVMYVNQLKACGGLRVKQIKTTDDAGQTMLILL